MIGHRSPTACWSRNLRPTSTILRAQGEGVASLFRVLQGREPSSSSPSEPSPRSSCEPSEPPALEPSPRVAEQVADAKLYLRSLQRPHHSPIPAPASAGDGHAAGAPGRNEPPKGYRWRRRAARWHLYSERRWDRWIERVALELAP